MQMLLGARSHASAQLRADRRLVLPAAAVDERDLTSAVAVRTGGTRGRDYLLLGHGPAHRVYGSRVVLGAARMGRRHTARR